jgi:Family of unknown function (DUF6232)
MEEEVFLKLDSVVVSSTRVVLGKKTFATRNIGSIAVRDEAIGFAPFLLVLVGLACLSSKDAMVFGILLLIGTAIYIFSRWGKQTMTVVAGGGEVVAIKSQPKAFVQKVSAAIEQAIAVR